MEIILNLVLIKAGLQKVPVIFEGEFWFMLIWKKQVLEGLYTDCVFNDFLNQAGYFFKKILL